MNEDKHREVIASIRRIIRATDVHSRQLVKYSGMTSAQILIMNAIGSGRFHNTSKIAEEVALSPATVTNIVERLEHRHYIERQRDEHDKRKVNLWLTETGREVLDNAPTLLQQSFIERFDRLESWEQNMIVAALQRVASLMNAEKLDASPVLDVGVLTRHMN
ncbi:MarR family transcriptional regulator [Natronospirillum operosum]|uniref:MarR family transcriptional regulator n=1 Tax=Natronospirillum operosum TaxID=2759953 RepID=A0A4Z0WCW9_9GAMM|nr:MarR family winged helix-turn-helix transcriptional regulator [Natronospirillum operosum]TGG92774.1 MarR family transcriptional regulator [Natronospirillum operosum]